MAAQGTRGYSGTLFTQCIQYTPHVFLVVSARITVKWICERLTAETKRLIKASFCFPTQKHSPVPQLHDKPDISVIHFRGGKEATPSAEA